MKIDVLKMLQNSGEHYISGEYISDQLGISRSAVWKHIQKLRKEGYSIESITNKGYKLVEKTLELNQTALESLVGEHAMIDRAYYLETVDSTNQMAKRVAMEFPGETAIIISREQTSGKGRRGRQWVSEKNGGLWLSLLLRPNISPENISKVTLIAAAALNQALEDITSLDIGIKWPNDIIVNGKKLAGILTELSAEPGYVNYLVVGVGINTNSVMFGEELESKATSLRLCCPNLDINHLNIVKLFVEQFELYYNQFVEFDNFDPVIEINRSKSVTLNQWVEIETLAGKETAYAVDIDHDGSLIVQDDNHKHKKIYYGEVSVRGVNGYV